MNHSHQILTAPKNIIQILLIEENTASDLLNLVSDENFENFEEFGFDEDYTYRDEDYTYHYHYEYSYTYTY